MNPIAYYIVAAAWIVWVHVRYFQLSAQKQRAVPGEPGYTLPREHTSRGDIEARLSPEGDIASWVPVSSTPDPSKAIKLVQGRQERWLWR